MSRRPRRNYSPPAFKARVTRETAKEEQIEVHPQSDTQWKKQLPEEATSVYEGN